MNTFYTAIGRYTTRRLPNGETRFIVIAADKEHYLDCAERIIWGALLWQVLADDELHDRCIPALRSHQLIDQYEATIQRLLQRGLLVCATGEPDFSLVYDLLSRLYIRPQRHGFLARLVTLFAMLFKGSGIRQAIGIFSHAHLPAKMTNLMKLTRRVKMTTAELVRCHDLQVRSIPDEASLVKQVYTDCSVTSESIHLLARQCACWEDVTMAVLVFYREGLVLFDRA